MIVLWVLSQILPSIIQSEINQNRWNTGIQDSQCQVSCHRLIMNKHCNWTKLCQRMMMAGQLTQSVHIAHEGISHQRERIRPKLDFHQLSRSVEVAARWVSRVLHLRSTSMKTTCLSMLAISERYVRIIQARKHCRWYWVKHHLIKLCSYLMI